MPDSPPPIFTPPAPGSPPDSPQSIYTPAEGGGSPGAPAEVYAPATGGSPPASPAEIYAPPGANNGPAIYRVSGSLSPNATGDLIPVAVPAMIQYPGRTQFSTDGNASHPVSGAWVQLLTQYLVTPAAATLEQIAPRANYVATGSQSTASSISVFDLVVGLKLYWLYDMGDGNPDTARWVDAADGGMADQGSLVIPAGRMLWPRTRLVSPNFIGGLGATWEAATNAVFFYRLARRLDAVAAGEWTGSGTRPETAAWTPTAPHTGVPVLEYVTPLPSPPAIFQP